MSAHANKIPRITLAFWIMKICATTLGETGGDLLAQTMHVGYLTSSLILIGVFLVSLIVQLMSPKCHAAFYWSVILTTSTAGTTMSDYMDRSLELGYTTGSLILVGILAAILIVWRLTLKDLSVANIRSFKVEAMYWTAILVSNTLGTALGDCLADDSGLGFGASALLISGVIAVVVALYFLTPISRVFLFWAAFVLTRPFGATAGDFLTKPTEEGGMNFGTIGSSAILGGVLVILVVWASFAKSQQPEETIPAPDAAPPANELEPTSTQWDEAARARAGD